MARDGRDGRGKSATIAGMGNIGGWEIAGLLLLALLLFGAKRLPEIGRSLGSGMREFKDSISGKVDDRAELPAAPPPEATAPVPTSHEHEIV
jgi:sec-independent protein translocase protein TatA